MVKTKKNFPVKEVSERIVDVLINVYATGVLDPSLEEIAIADAKANGSLHALSDVRRVEASVRADMGLLLNASGHQMYAVIPLNARYYADFRPLGPVTDMAAARKCIAGRGRGSSTEGFAFVEGHDSPLLKAYLETLATRLRGGVEALEHRVDAAIEAGRLTDGGRDSALLPSVSRTRAMAAHTAKELRAQKPVTPTQDAILDLMYREDVLTKQARGGHADQIDGSTIPGWVVAARIDDNDQPWVECYQWASLEAAYAIFQHDWAEKDPDDPDSEIDFWADALGQQAAIEAADEEERLAAASRMN